MKKPVKTNATPAVSNPANSRELSAEQLAEANGGGGFDLNQSYGFDISGDSAGTVSFPAIPAFDLGSNNISITFPKG